MDRKQAAQAQVYYLQEILADIRCLKTAARLLIKRLKAACLIVVGLLLNGGLHLSLEDIVKVLQALAH